MPDVSVSAEDVSALAAKLDKLDKLLTDKERAILLVLFGLATTEFGRSRLAAARVSLPATPSESGGGTSLRSDEPRPLPAMGPMATLPPPSQTPRRKTLNGIPVADSLSAALRQFGEFEDLDTDTDGMRRLSLHIDE